MPHLPSSVRRIVALVLAASTAAGCTGPTANLAQGNTASRAIGDGGVSNAYTIAPGDRLRVTVFGDAGLTAEYGVDESGVVVLPLAGPVNVAGRSSEQAGAAIAGALKTAQVLRDPSVTVEVISLQPFYILGEVTRPGEYPYKPGMSLLAAVATAGGYTYRADTAKVIIRNVTEKTERVYDLNGDIAIRPGDRIQVPEKYF